MVSRKALIIGSPDETIPGVNVDVENLKNYLKSAIGGFWYEHEITVLESPLRSVVKNEISTLRFKDYSFVLFAGHGYHSVERKRTMLHINKLEEMDSLDLRIGASKHSLILDCCRKPQSERRIAKAYMESYSMDSSLGQKPNPIECRKYFDGAISACEDGLVVMNACAINETAGEDELNGGYYTSSLIDAASEWVKGTLSQIDLNTQYATFSTKDCHEAAAVQVNQLSGGRQNPNFESPRTERKFPFAVVA